MDEVGELANRQPLAECLLDEFGTAAGIRDGEEDDNVASSRPNSEGDILAIGRIGY